MGHPLFFTGRFVEATERDSKSQRTKDKNLYLGYRQAGEECISLSCFIPMKPPLIFVGSLYLYNFDRLLFYGVERFGLVFHPLKIDRFQVEAANIAVIHGVKIDNTVCEVGR